MLELRSTVQCCVLGSLVTVVTACGNAHVAGGDGGPGGRDGSVITIDEAGTITLPDGRVIRPGEDGGGITLADGSVLPGEDGGSSTVDGGRRPRTDGRIGTPCMSEDDCDGRFCAGASSGLGYCSWVCADDVPCPDGAVCVESDTRVDYGYCLVGCGPGSTVACPPGTVCTSGFGLPEPVCIAGCETDAECPMGTECGPGFGGAGRCFTPEAMEGRPCADDAECGETSFCANEEAWGFAAGICLAFGCDPSDGSGCSDTTVCVEFDGGGLCLPRCDAMSECRAGYECVPSPTTDVNACIPRCTHHSECTDGRRCDFLTGRCFVPS